MRTASCFRRELVKEKLREKLDLEKRAVKVVERHLEDSVTEDFLVDCVCITEFTFAANQLKLRVTARPLIVNILETSSGHYD